MMIKHPNEAGLTPLELAFTKMYYVPQQQKAALSLAKKLCKKHLELMLKRSEENVLARAENNPSQIQLKDAQATYSNAEQKCSFPNISNLSSNTYLDSIPGGDAYAEENEFMIFNEQDQSLFSSPKIKFLQRLLGISVYCDDTRITKSILKHFSMNPFHEAFNGNSPLLHAILAGNTNALRLFLHSKYSYVGHCRQFDL